MKKWILAGIAVVAALVVYFAVIRQSKPTATAPATPPTAAATPPTTKPPTPETNEGRSGALPVLVDDDPKGDLPLEGVVFDAQDKPVAGAIVALSSNPPRTVASGDDGTFTFPDLVGRSYTVTARAAAGVAGPVTARLTGKSEPLVLHLRPGGEVAVTVVGPDAKPIDGATVELRDIDVQSAKTTSDGKA
nr:carboxypeptidase-like regulatory domain-containing protein [Kofleriaceae bacterium]